MTSQTQWIVDGKRLYPSSIEEEMSEPLLKYFNSQHYLFHAGGREDADVRMLGNGRPFIFQLINPKHTSTVSV